MTGAASAICKADMVNARHENSRGLPAASYQLQIVYRPGMLTEKSSSCRPSVTGSLKPTGCVPEVLRGPG
jgi:hypothetical protein